MSIVLISLFAQKPELSYHSACRLVWTLILPDGIEFADLGKKRLTHAAEQCM
jgi:hypothetical protein